MRQCSSCLKVPRPRGRACGVRVIIGGGNGRLELAPSRLGQVCTLVATERSSISDSGLILLDRSDLDSDIDSNEDLISELR